MKQFFLTMLGVFAGLILFVVVLPIALIVMAVASASNEPRTSPNTVLELDLRQGLTDQTPQNPLFILGGSGLSTTGVVEALAQAEDDRHVKAVLVRLPEAGMSPAAADEIRQAIRRFRASGKPVVAHTQGFQPVGAAVSSYMVGAAASELWMQNNAAFRVAGLSSDEVFLGGALEKYGVRADLEQRYEYKNAANQLTQRGFTEPHREAMTAWMSSIYETALASIAQDRKLQPAQLRAVIEAAPYTARQALSLKLIDRIGQPEEAEAAIKRRAGRNAQLVEIDEYARARGDREGAGADVIAIIGGEGAIVTGDAAGADPFASASNIHSDVLAEAIYEAADDGAVKAIVLRVSSPGGSPEASEQIAAAVRAAKAAGKPVVVSMGDYAASGGYWISAEATEIVAQPSTITGSIGVFGGKFVVSDLLARFGVNMEPLAVGGDYADAFSVARPFSPGERAAFNAEMDRIYEEFVARVAAGRKLPAARVREIARGRVWTGAQARQLGLVDHLGGLEEAIARARALARIPQDRSVRFQRYPEAQTPWEALSEVFGVQAESARALVTLGGVFAQPEARAILAEARTQRLRSQGATVLADQPLR